MTESDVYLEIADRSLRAAATLNSSIHEKATFLVYHAFESAGGALCAHRSVPYPKSHKRKLDTFVATVRRDRRLGRQVARLALELAALRNLVLYPRVLGNGAVERPVNQVPPKYVERLRGRTETVVKRVRVAR